MEQKIREYEEFIEKEAKRKMSAADRKQLAELHHEMVANFQHERLIHLIITLFFAVFAVAAVFVTAWVIIEFSPVAEMVPLYLLTFILVILTIFYVRHYYFLENHTQELYKYTKLLRNEAGNDK